ncbi:ACR092Cp [Eremothecium gossypii ATCC 10895]|uniref:ACR092Cp n=1 Tax=Eremothecium gossypii (strain ATCC 10895 / CBS 109.51 / FGSC 9923 / NRRL Y-1056) TaxID=284811 RepID=Q75C25_EREGS|nr:ACR092Cp [Eremothecium gossypii ATCC 10895]AAS51318.1 ACR092Cp [Eremothecium gossypii ATCC 10895]AEY95610.1 FACR092Cp [Eremothecium gossypii FDAG1]
MSIFSEDTQEVARYSDNPQFEEWGTDIVSNLFEMNGQLGTFQHFIKGLESNYRNGKANTMVVENISNRSMEVIHKVSLLVKTLNGLVHSINAIPKNELDRTQLTTREKLNRDIRLSVQEFQRCQSEFAGIRKQINEQAKISLSEQQEEAAGAAALEEEAAQQQHHIVIEREPINNEEFAYQQELIRKRDEEIANIERGIVELNEVFQDLGSIVQQQSELVDHIENNIYTAVTSTNHASNELSRALRYQRRSNRWCLYLLLALLALLFLIGVTVL